MMTAVLLAARGGERNKIRLDTIAMEVGLKIGVTIRCGRGSAGLSACRKITLPARQRSRPISPPLNVAPPITGSEASRFMLPGSRRNAVIASLVDEKITGPVVVTK
jgi:hypothetical protein